MLLLQYIILYSMITVSIPSEKKGLSLFAHGGAAHVETLPDATVFTFDDKSPVILFYTFPSMRRAYIIYGKETGCKRILPLVRPAVTVLYTATGRRIDVLKRMLFLLDNLTYGAYFGFDALFYRELGLLLDQKKMGKRTLITLLEKYGYWYAEQEKRSVPCDSCR